MDDKIFVIKQGENPGLFEVYVVCFIIFFEGGQLGRWTRGSGSEYDITFHEIIHVTSILHTCI